MNNNRQQNAPGVVKVPDMVNNSALLEPVYAKKCNKIGYYTSFCFTRGVSQVAVADEQDDSDDDNFLGSVELPGESQWHTTVCLNNKDVEFKLDTGAEVTVISETIFSTLSDVKLKKPTKTFYGLTKSLKVIGQFTGCFQYQSTFCKLH